MLPFAPDFRRLVLAFHKLIRVSSRHHERLSGLPGETTPLVGARENISEEVSVKRGRGVESGAGREKSPPQPNISLASRARGRTKKMLFETGERCVRLKRSAMSGNAVKIGDGCATVTEYELPQPLPGL